MSSRLPVPVGYHWDRVTPIVLSCGSRPCRWCKGAIPAGRRKTFCSDICVQQWKRRTHPEILRWDQYGRDRGICQDCGLDLATVDIPMLQQAYNMAREPGRPALMALILKATEWRVRAGIKDHTFEVDHIVPLVRGGDPFDPSNLRTLCVPCHRVRTEALNRELARERRTARAVPPKRPDPARARRARRGHGS